VWQRCRLTDILNDRVIPFFDKHEIHVGRILTDRALSIAVPTIGTNTSSTSQSRNIAMIPDIGLMIAAYIVTRLTAMLGQPLAETNVVAKIFCAIAIIITVFSAGDLLQHGVSIPPGLAR
jgi:hypothetical protein